MAPAERRPSRLRPLRASPESHTEWRPASCTRSDIAGGAVSVHGSASPSIREVVAPQAVSDVRARGAPRGAASEPRHANGPRARLRLHVATGQPQRAPRRGRRRSPPAHSVPGCPSASRRDLDALGRSEATAWSNAPSPHTCRPRGRDAWHRRRHLHHRSVSSGVKHRHALAPGGDAPSRRGGRQHPGRVEAHRTEAESPTAVEGRGKLRLGGHTTGSIDGPQAPSAVEGVAGPPHGPGSAGSSGNSTDVVARLRREHGARPRVAWRPQTSAAKHRRALGGRARAGVSEARSAA
jgi:hypothetical protein